MPRLAALLVLLLAALPVQAAESEAVRSARATATLVTDAATIAPGEAFRAALRLRLAPGWHTYWLNAGDAGAAPEIALTLPDGGTAGGIAWPAPQRIQYGPLVNFGYTGEVLLPVTVTPPADLAPGSPYVIGASATWLVCEQVCIPEEGTFRLSLPVGPAAVPDTRLAPLFARAAAAAPRPSPWTARAAFGNGRGSLTLDGAGLSRTTVRDAFFFPAEPNLIDNAAPQAVTLRDGALTLALAAAPDAMAPATLDGVLVLTDGGGQRTAFAIAAPVSGAPAAEPGLPFWQAALFAVLGGLLLNLMPCVFPVLAMKAMALARLSGAQRREIRLHAASYTLGVLATFAVLGGGLVALRAGGATIGWGFQFTQPAFVAALAWLMLAVGLNLSGVYAVGGGGNLGAAAAGRGGHAGSFLTGALAVLVATPCTAPFMAAALGAALAMPAAETMAVFLALGLGLALPYALLGLFPRLAQAMPRPGRWMEALRQALAFPMYAAAIWLVWVLAQLSGPDGVLAVLAGGLLIAFAAWIFGRTQQAGRGLALGGALVLAAVLGAAALLPRIGVASAASGVPAAEAWSEARVAALRAEGRGVFVNATAAWCITCKVNERMALATDAVRAAFSRGEITYLVADWTRGDAAIGALLRAHGREGVPLYLFYPAGGGAPEVLPQLLTEGMVLRAIGG